jgi:hypothetical protein
VRRKIRLPAVEVNAASLRRTLLAEELYAASVSNKNLLTLYDASQMLTSDKKPEECDATKASTCTNADPQNLFFSFLLANQMVVQDFSFQK